jgi:hypothetical protein
MAPMVARAHLGAPAVVKIERRAWIELQRFIIAADGPSQIALAPSDFASVVVESRAVRIYPDRQVNIL